MIQFGIPAAHTLNKGNLLSGLTVRWSYNPPFPAQDVFQFQIRHNIFEDPISVRLILGIKRRKTCGQNNSIGLAGDLTGRGIERNGLFRTGLLASTTGLIRQIQAFFFINGEERGMVAGHALDDGAVLGTLL